MRIVINGGKNYLEVKVLKKKIKIIGSDLIYEIDGLKKRKTQLAFRIWPKSYTNLDMNSDEWQSWQYSLLLYSPQNIDISPEYIGTADLKLAEVILSKIEVVSYDPYDI